MSLGSIQILLDISLAKPIFESIQGKSITRTWIDSIKEAIMHPVKFLFEDIYRNHWGLPPSSKDAADRRRAIFPLEPRLSIFRKRRG
jgi:hypothetical protein